MNIKTPAELQKAVEHAFSYIRKYKKEDRILIEEYFTGHDLRLFVVGDKVISVVQREPAYIMGDGQSTIRQLIQTFNKEWQSPMKYDLPLCPIPFDKELSRYLAKQKLTLNSIPPQGKKEQLRWNANVSTGGRPFDVTDAVHPSIKELAIKAAKISNLEVCGIDILCKDITSDDVTKNNVAILEINDTPGFDIHYYPVEGTGQDICTAILDHIFKDSKYIKEPTEAQIASLLNDIDIKYKDTIADPAI